MPYFQDILHLLDLYQICICALGQRIFYMEAANYSFIYVCPKGLVLMNGYEFRLSKMCLQLVTAVGIWKVPVKPSFQLWPRYAMNSFIFSRIHLSYLLGTGAGSSMCVP